MKKIISLLLCCILLLSGTLASAANLDFLTNGALLRYAGNDTVTVEFEMSSGFLNEIIERFGGEEASAVVDIAGIIKGIANQSQTAKVAAKVSEDYKRMEVSLEAETVNDIPFNKNLDVTVRARMGMWMDLDYTDAANPKCKLIYSTPAVNKYVVIDLFNTPSLYADAQERDKVIALLGAICNRDVMQGLAEKGRALIEKHATISAENSMYTIHFDNAAFCRYLADMICMYVDFYALEGMLEPTAADEIKLTVLTALPQLKLLGTDGYTMVYSVTKKRTVQKATMDADINFSLKEIFNAFEDVTGGWPLESDGRISMRIREELKVTLSGDSVYVTYPELTAENSINYADLFPEPEIIEPEEDYEAYEPTYPDWYISACTESPVLKHNGTYYFPLRAVMDSAYYTEYAIDYVHGGPITLTSPWFETVQIEIGKDYALVGGEQIPIGEVFLYEDSTTYVSRSFFEKVFGWRLMSLIHDLENEQYWIEFVTVETEG